MMLCDAYSNLAGFHPTFRLEPFVAVRKEPPHHYEVLTVLPNGQNAEEFFATLQQNPALAVAADIRILTAAFEMFQRTNPRLRASYNVNSATIFSGELNDFLEGCINKGSVDPIWLSNQKVEVLEHDLPLGYDVARLQQLKDKFGIGYALDDITWDAKSLERIALIGDGADMFKFHHSVLQEIRQGNECVEGWLHNLRQGHPTKIFVVEGLDQSRDAGLIPFLKILGIDAAQVHTKREIMDGLAEETSRLARESGWGALDVHP